MSRLRVFRLLHFRQLRRQPGRALLAFLAVGAGVSLTVASGLLVVSIERSTTDVLAALGGPAPLRVDPRTSAGLEPALVGRVARTEGVEAVVPAVQAVAAGEGRGRDTYAMAIGVDCRIEALTGPFGCDARSLRPPRRDAPVLISTAFARSLGSSGVIRTDEGRVPIEGVTTNDSLNDINEGRVVVFELETAQRLFGRGDHVDAIHILPTQGTDIESLRARLLDVVGDWNAVSLRDELMPLLGFSGPLTPLLFLVAVIALGLSALLVYNIVALSFAERRRDLAVAGALGVTPRSMTAGIVGEAFLLGLVGGMIGALAGIAFAYPIVGATSSVLTESAVGLPIRVHIAPTVLLLGVAAGGLSAAGAAFIPARRARRIDVAAELHGRALSEEDPSARRRLRFAMLLAATGVAIALSHLARSGGALEAWQPPLGTVTLLAIVVLLFATAGAAAPLLIGVIQRLLDAAGGPVRVAIANLVRQPRRTGVVAAAVSAAVGMACVLSALASGTRGAIYLSENISDGRVWVSTFPINNSALKPSSSVIAGLRKIPGVRSVDRVLTAGIADAAGGGESRRYGGELGVAAYEGLDGIPLSVVLGRADASALRGNGVVVGTSAARDRRLRPGSTLRIPTPQGFVNLRVTGVVSSSLDNGYIAFVSPERFVSLFGSQPPEEVFVRPERGVSVTDLARRVNEARLDPSIHALTPDELTVRLADEVVGQAEPFWVVQRALLFVSLVATLSTLLLVGVQRRRELGVLGAVGFGPAHLGRMTLAEAVAAGATGAILGAVGSLGLFEVLRNVAAVGVGVRPPFSFAPGAAIIAIGLALAVVAVGGLLPAWRTSRLQIVEAIRDE